MPELVKFETRTGTIATEDPLINNGSRIFLVLSYFSVQMLSSVRFFMRLFENNSIFISYLM